MREQILDTDYYTANQRVGLMYRGLEVMYMSFEMMIKAVTVPFILEAKLLGVLDHYLWSKGFMDWNPEYPQRKAQ